MANYSQTFDVAVRKDFEDVIITGKRDRKSEIEELDEALDEAGIKESFEKVVDAGMTWFVLACPDQEKRQGRREELRKVLYGLGYTIRTPTAWGARTYRKPARRGKWIL